MTEPYNVRCLRERESYLVSKIQDLQDELERVRSEIQNPLAWPIDALEVSVRTWNCIKHADAPTPHPKKRGNGYIAPPGWAPPTQRIDTVADLIRWSKNDLMNLNNFGSKCLREVEEILSGLGLALAS